eukprot:456494_1
MAASTEPNTEQLITQLEELQKENKSLQEIKDQFEILQRDYAALKQQKSSSRSTSTKNRYSAEFWKDVEAKLKNDTDGIKALIVNGTITKHDVDRYGETLLHKAAFFGNLEIAQLCINMDYDVRFKNKDGRTPFEQAQRNSAHHVEQALLFAEMETNIGERIKEVSQNINKQKGISDAFVEELSVIGPQNKEIFRKCLEEVLINLIRKNKIFSDDMLCLCWKLMEEEKKDPLQSELLQCITTECQSIIQKKDKYRWFWLRHCILPSNIWYTNTHTDDGYLYYKLLGLIKNESQKQLNLLVDNMKTEVRKDEIAWNKLTQYTVPTKALSGGGLISIRQDLVPNGVISEYAEEGLHREATNESFDGAAFYDMHSYLPRLSLLSEIVDHDFQKSIRTVYNVDSSSNIGRISAADDDEKIDVLYRRGPVKLLNRAMRKTENDYYTEAYPTSAALLDFNRCSLVFDDIASLLNGLTYFVNKVHAFQCGNIIGIVRCKNAFVGYAGRPGYADVKLNVLIRGTSNNIIGEVQFLLKTMIEYKIRAHNLYSIEREEEFMSGSATKLLPSLLDEDKQIAVLAAMGNTKAICQYLLYHNKTEGDIISANSILIPICKGGKHKAFNFFMDSMSYEEKLRHLFASDEYESTPIERAIRNNKLVLLQHIFGIGDVTKMLREDNDWTLRVLYNLFKNCNDCDMIDYVLDALQITQQRLIQMMDYKYSCSSHTTSKYYRNKIINEMIFNNTLKIFRKLSQLMGETAFAQRMFEVDFKNRNALEMAVQKQKTEHIKHVLAMKSVRDKYESDKLLIHRLIYNLFVKLKDDAVIDLVMATWNISHDAIIQSISFEYPVPKRTTTAAAPGSYKYHQWNIIGSVIYLQSLNRLKKLVDICGEKVFQSNVLCANGEDINGVEYGIRDNKLQTIQYVMSFDAVRQACLANQDTLWRIVYWTVQPDSFNVQMAKYIMNVMHLNHAKLKQLQAWKCHKPKLDYQFTYWDKTLSDHDVQKLLKCATKI